MEGDEQETFSNSSSSEDEALFEAEFGEVLETVLRGIAPYRYEPYLDQDPLNEPLSDSEEETNGAEGGQTDGDHAIDIERLGNTQWCSCGNCEAMDTVEESVCCQEQQMVSAKREKQEGILCITEHHGFEPVCLNEEVLSIAYDTYKQYGGVNFGNEWKRYTAYRQFIRWCYHYLGKEVRVPLPSCAVGVIRRTFSSGDYTGFKDSHEE